MTRKSFYRETGRAVFLTALVVLSVVIVSVPVAGATATADESATDADLTISSSDTEMRSNIATMTVELENTDTAFVRVGTIEEVNYEVVLEVVDGNGDGEVTVQMSSTEADTKTRASTNFAYTAADSDDRVSLQTMDGLYTPLPAGDYPLAVSTDDGREFDDTIQDTATLTLESREALDTNALSTYTALTREAVELGENETVADLDAPVSDAGTVIDGHQLLAVLETDSLHTYFERAESFNRVNGFLEMSDHADDSLNLVINEQESATEWRTDSTSSNDISDHVTILEASQSDGYAVFRIDYEAINADDELDELSSDTSYELTFSVAHDFEYASETAQTDGVDEEATTAFALEERTLSLDEGTDALPASANATVTGETNAMPGTTVSDTLELPGRFSITGETEVESDGTFAIEHDLSGHDADTPYTLVVEEAGGASASLEGTLAADRGSTVVETDAPDAVTTGESAILDVTVRNDGGDATTTAYTVTIDGETVDERDLELDADDSLEESYELETGTDGAVEWSVTTGDATDSGTLTVDSASDDGADDTTETDTSALDDGESSESESGDETADTLDDGTTTDSETDDGSGATSETGDGDSMSGFGLTVALAALLTAAIGALHRGS